jgi:hypothetical protein
MEVIIGLSLLAMLLTTLFFWYKNLNLQKGHLSKVRGPLLEERYAFQRLNASLPTASTPFFGKQGNLAFCFDNGPNSIPELSGTVLGHLFFDEKQKCLCLGIWPKPNRDIQTKDPFKTLILLDSVENCEFSFYHPPDLFKKTVDPEQVGRVVPKEGWQNEWKLSYKSLPALVKISVSRNFSNDLKIRSFEYCFDLPSFILLPKAKS